MAKGTVYDFYKDMPTWSKGVSVLVILGLGVLTYFGVKKWLKNRPPKVNYPNGGLGIPKGFNAEAYADEAYKQMKGADLLINVKKESVLMQILALSTDDMFAAVYDAFNQVHMKEGDGTFREWINDEYLTPGTGLKDKLNARFERLGLK